MIPRGPVSSAGRNTTATIGGDMELRMAGITKHAYKLDDMDLARQWMVKAAQWAGMTIINGPTVTSFREHSDLADAGLSGFCIFAESHISLHTWPELGYVWFDVVSCKVFDPTHIVALTRDFYDIVDWPVLETHSNRAYDLQSRLTLANPTR